MQKVHVPILKEDIKVIDLIIKDYGGTSRAAIIRKALQKYYDVLAVENILNGSIQATGSEIMLSSSQDLLKNKIFD